MARVDLKPELDKFVQKLQTRNTYGGAPISSGIMRMIQVEITNVNQGVTAPYWLGVLERGRGPRKSTVDTNLWKRIYAWMQKRNMFTSKTVKGKINEAKGMTWYINKYGNQQFRTKVFVDIYTTARKETIEEINNKYAIAIGKITQDIL